MNTFYFIKSHKLIVFGLILSFCLCFIRPVSSYADDSLPGEYTFGCVDYSGQRYEVSNDQPLNLFQLIMGGADRVLSPTYDQNLFNTCVRSLGLGDYFYNWDIYNPLFYVNVYCSDAFSGYTNYYLDFRKSTYSDVSFDYHVFSDRVLFSNSEAFPCLRNDVANRTYYLGSFPKNFYIGLNYLTNSDKFYLIGDYNSSSNISYGGVTYPLNVHSYWNTAHDFSSEFSSFLSDPDAYSFTIRFSVNKSTRNFYYIFSGQNVGLYTGSIRYECLFSSFFVYSLNSDIVMGNGSDSFSDYFTFLVTDDFPFYDLYDLLVPFTVGLTWDLNNVIPTPTPIPSPEWLTPTPMPTVTPVPVTLTPIPQYINPDLDIDSTEVKSALSGYLDIIDDTFSNFAIFALGSQVLSYLYSFSSYFSFVLLIPAICLIAYAIGRLNQK